MGRGAKIALIVGGGGLVVVVALAATCIVVGSRLASRTLADVGERAVEAEAEGEAVGRGTTSDRCVDLAAERAGACRPMDIPCMSGARVLLGACLRTATTPESFCEVPSPFDVAETGAWAAAYCASRGHGRNPACPGLMGEVQLHCHGATRPRFLAPNATEPRE